MRRSGILCGGTWVVDVVKTVDRWPEEETLAQIDGQEEHCGGPGQNIAIALARLGARFPIGGIGRLGDDEHARIIRRSCAEHGVDATGLASVADLPTAYTDVISVRGSGRRTFFFCAGAGSRLVPSDFDLEASPARILHVGAPGLHSAMDAPAADAANGWAALLNRAKALGFRTNMELVTLAPERIRALVAPCLPFLDSLVVNDAEIGAIADVATVRAGRTDVAACRQAARRLVDAHGIGLAVAHFPGGCVAATPERDFAVPAVRVPATEVASANGAGDGFAAGVVFGLHEGWPLGEALRLGHAVAAASLRSLSTTEAIEDADACFALADRWGWRDPACLENGR